MIGFGIAGTGSMAARMTSTIVASGEAQAVRVSSGSVARAQAFAAQYRVPASGDFDAMLADPDVDAVYVAGHNRDHAAMAIAALRARKAVLCEKPLATDVADTEAVIDTARSTGLLLMEAVATPFLPALAEPIARARLGEFGAIRSVAATFGYPVDRAVLPGLFAPDAGVLLDRAVYPLTLALLLLGPIVDSEMRCDIDDAGVDIAAQMRLTHRDGGASDLAASFVEQLSNRLVIGCEKACITIGPPLITAQHFSIGSTTTASADVGHLGRVAQNPLGRRFGDLAARLAGRWRPFGPSLYAPELQHFCELLRQGRTESPIMSHAITLAVQRIIADAKAAA